MANFAGFVGLGDGEEAIQLVIELPTFLNGELGDRRLPGVDKGGGGDIGGGEGVVGEGQEGLSLEILRTAIG